MANEKAVLYISANRPVTGREQDAINLWVETPGWLERQQRANWFARWDGLWLTAHGGTTNGVWVCYGERAQAGRVAPHRRVRGLGVPRPTCLEDLCVCPGVTFDGMRDAFDRRKRALGK